MDFKISAKLAQEILNYLVQRPYAEVYKLIQELQIMCVEQETPEE